MLNIQKTKQEIIKDKLIEINRGIEYTIEVLINRTADLRSQFFNDPECSPQEFADFIGPGAMQLNEILKATEQFIKSIKPDYEMQVLPEIKWTKTGEVAEILPINTEMI